MDKLEIKQGYFIQQTQYFIPVEIDLSVVPARLGIWFFHLSRRTNVNVEACTCSWVSATLNASSVGTLISTRLEQGIIY